MTFGLMAGEMLRGPRSPAAKLRWLINGRHFVLAHRHFDGSFDLAGLAGESHGRAGSTAESFRFTIF